MELAAPHFRDMVGIDVADSMLAEARRRVPSAELINADVMADPNAVGKFRVISLFRFILSAEPHLREGVLAWLRGFEIMDTYGFGVIPPWRKRRRLPSRPLLKLERLLSSRQALQRHAKDRIYLCRPTAPADA
jgi:hypothetical protein